LIDLKNFPVVGLLLVGFPDNLVDSLDTLDFPDNFDNSGNLVSRDDSVVIPLAVLLVDNLRVL